MPETDHLIAELSRTTAPVMPLAAPRVWALRLCVILGVYLAGAQAFLGLRPDLALQLHRPFFLAEVLLLAGICLSSGWAAIRALYPDSTHSGWSDWLPWIFTAALALLLLGQFALPADARMMLPSGTGLHAMECAVCIASVALIPSLLLFTLLRRGATIRPLTAGIWAVFCAGSIGCLTLRLAEANDSLLHLVMWHYLPTLLFAACGAGIGKIFLKW
jgi:hypothetical protein